MSDKRLKKSKTDSARSTRREKTAAARARGRGFFRRAGAGLGRMLRAVGHGLSAAARAVGRFLRRIRKAFLYVVCTGALVGASALILAAVVSAGVVDVTEPYILTPDAAADEAGTQGFDCILVLGAGLRGDGSPSPMLYDRVLTACELADACPGSILLMSGDHTGDYNEPAVMKETAVSLGADSPAIFLDHKGYSTYESVSRAAEVYGARRVLIVTQEYHLYRAVYIARTLGLDAYGVAADKRPYRKALIRETRELLARYKDFFTSGSRASCADGDAPVDLHGNGDMT